MCDKSAAGPCGDKNCKWWVEWKELNNCTLCRVVWDAAHPCQIDDCRYYLCCGELSNCVLNVRAERTYTFDEIGRIEGLTRDTGRTYSHRSRQAVDQIEKRALRILRTGPIRINGREYTADQFWRLICEGEEGGEGDEGKHL